MVDYWTYFRYRYTGALAETRITVLPNAEDRMIVCSFVWTKHQNAMDEQTDIYPLAITAVSTSSNADTL